MSSFFYCVLSYRPVSSLGTNQRRKFLPDCICKYGMQTPSRLTISLVSKFLKKGSHSYFLTYKELSCYTDHSRRNYARNQSEIASGACDRF